MFADEAAFPDSLAFARISCRSLAISTSLIFWGDLINGVLSGVFGLCLGDVNVTGLAEMA